MLTPAYTPTVTSGADLGAAPVAVLAQTRSGESSRALQGSVVLTGLDGSGSILTLTRSVGAVSSRAVEVEAPIGVTALELPMAAFVARDDGTIGMTVGSDNAADDDVDVTVTLWPAGDALDAAAVRDAVGLDSADLDAKFTALGTPLQSGSYTAPLDATQTQAAAAAAITAADLATALTAAIQDGLLDEADGKAVLQALADKIAADWVAGDASPQAIVAALVGSTAFLQAVRDALKRAPSGGAGAAGSIDVVLASIAGEVNNTVVSSSAAATRALEAKNAAESADGKLTADRLAKIGRLPESGTVPNTTDLTTGLSGLQTHGDETWVGGEGGGGGDVDEAAIAEAVWTHEERVITGGGASVDAAALATLLAPYLLPTDVEGAHVPNSRTAVLTRNPSGWGSETPLRITQGERGVNAPLFAASFARDEAGGGGIKQVTSIEVVSKPAGAGDADLTIVGAPKRNDAEARFVLAAADDAMPGQYRLRIAVVYQSSGGAVGFVDVNVGAA